MIESNILFDDSLPKAYVEREKFWINPIFMDGIRWFLNYYKTFANRLYDFVFNTEVNDPASEEEKEYLLTIAKEFQKLNNTHNDILRRTINS